jgi:hypothetical protein
MFRIRLAAGPPGFDQSKFCGNYTAMHMRPLSCLASICLSTAALATPVSAQVVEMVGSRALGMGGAFVAVANDSSATWWNPAGLAAGPFFDMALARVVSEDREALPTWRERASWFALGTPPLGLGYYRFRITDIQPFDPTGGADPDREERRAGVPVRSLSASQFGITLVQTLLPGVHTGTTLKYVRGTLHRSREDGLTPPAELIDLGEALDGGDAEGRFDLDLGVLAVAGPVRLGGVVRNLREPEFGSAGAEASGIPALRMSRQVRVGAAFDPGSTGGLPLTVALDADVREYDTTSGARRVVAIGGEHWLFDRRVGVRAGGRFNTVGAEDRAATAGVSVSLRSGMYIDGHVVRGTTDEEGWGLAARVSF